jgi:REP element-mobilizing transposase RayT
LFGEIVNANMNLSAAGKVVDRVWGEMFQFDEEIASWIVMPNHVHGIVAIGGDNSGIGARKKPLGRLMGAFKTTTTKRINELRGTPGTVVWQRGFYEHIIRDDRSLENIATYIRENPSQWESDLENPDAPNKSRGVQ